MVLGGKYVFRNQKDGHFWRKPQISRQPCNGFGKIDRRVGLREKQRSLLGREAVCQNTEHHRGV